MEAPVSLGWGLERDKDEMRRVSVPATAAASALGVAEQTLGDGGSRVNKTDGFYLEKMDAVGGRGRPPRCDHGASGAIWLEGCED